MQYKKSFYNELIAIEGTTDVLIYNTMTGGIIALEPEYFRLYQSHELFDDSFISVENTKLNELQEILISEKFLCATDFDEKKFLMIQSDFSRFDKSSPNLIIAPTLKCNMRCPYCYESARKNTEMSNETQKNLLKFIKSLIHSARNFNVTWYGGEPLLAVDKIFELSKEIIKLCDERHITYTSNMISNGYLLNDNLLEQLHQKAHLETVQITLDGLASTHNKRRTLKNGKVSFEQIIKNIDLARQYIKVKIRVNIDRENKDELPRLINLVHEKGWFEDSHILFYCAPVRSEENDPLCLTWKEFSETYNNYLDLISPFLNYQSLENKLTRLKQTPCMATRGYSYVIDPEGNIYKCMEKIDRPEFAISNLNHPILPLCYQEYSYLKMIPPKKCNDCTYLPCCQGDCPNRWDTAKYDWCDFQKDSHIHLIKILYNQKRNFQ